MEVPKKLKIELPYDPAIPLLGIFQNHNSKTVIYHNVHCSSIHNSQDMEATYVSIDRWMNKEDVAHIYNGILLSHKRKWNWVICSEVDGPRDCHTEWRKSEREKQTPYANTYVWNLKKKKKKKEFWRTRGRTGIKMQRLRMDLSTRGGGRVSWDEVRVAWTYIHYKM